MKALALFVGVVALAACGSSSDSKAPPLLGDSDCKGAACSGVGPSQNVGSGTGGTDATGAGGSGGDGPTVMITATVEESSSLDLSVSALYPSAATISVDSGATAAWDGKTAVTLAVPAGDHVFTVQPTAADVRPSLFAASVTEDGTLTLEVVDNQTLSSVVAALPMPGTFNSSAPVAVISLVDSSGKALSGATVTLPSTTATIAYDDGTGWGGTVTGPQGEVLLLNVGSAVSQAMTITATGHTTITTEVPLSFSATTFVAFEVP